jgi:hypothetical protein
MRWNLRVFVETGVHVREANAQSFAKSRSSGVFGEALMSARRSIDRKGFRNSDEQ